MIAVGIEAVPGSPASLCGERHQAVCSGNAARFWRRHRPGDLCPACWAQSTFAAHSAAVKARHPMWDMVLHAAKETL